MPGKDNAAFELGERQMEGASSSHGPPQPYQAIKTVSTLKIFLVCLLATVLTTIITLIVVVTYKPPQYSTTQTRQGTPTDGNNKPKLTQIDTKYRFLSHLYKSKLFKFPGGTVQWSRYRQNPEEYPDRESREFGTNINKFQSKMTGSILRIKRKGMRVPHWHLNSNEHGYVLQGTAWIGVVDENAKVVGTFNITVGQVFFLPKNTMHWMKNVGPDEVIFLLFFTIHEQLRSIDVDDAFFATPQDIAARALKPIDGIKFIKSFKRAEENQAVNLPPNLDQLIRSASYPKASDDIVAKYFYDLKGSITYIYPGGTIQWARYRKDTSSLNKNEKIYSEFLNENEDSLTISTMDIPNNGLRVPHFHTNANEMVYIARGCGSVGVFSPGNSVSNFYINTGDLAFFPIGTQHFVKSICDEPMLAISAFSTGNQLETLDIHKYYNATADHILAQLFMKPQDQVKRLKVLEGNQALNMP
ncbi:uncharacterized LOC103184852 [Callorhinchus milii]|uniref:Oxalate decarboxylase oxdD-like protein n=1 Tax=Callorhinchus milii TaxID=7868 RepID=V9KGI1_CALMI|nr:uncharacterized LOC103184852 [Callorhinchus milii]|eukprot:gi/632969751/ref/XP_007901258.1/ PREDICTED: uncharacterized protein LOC103184852 [Callorhinchus milii]